MAKNIAIAILGIVVVVETALLGRRFLQHPMMHRTSQSQSVAATNSPSGPPAGMKPPAFPKKGDKLSDLPVAKTAYQVAPGDMLADTKTATAGWSIVQNKQSDGSLIVDFIPKEANDQRQQYTVKTGETLYFVELNSVDDSPGQNDDINLRDDYGIITNADGIIQ